MKKILFLLLVTVSTYAQVSTGKETKFANGIRNTSSQTLTDPINLVTEGADGTYGKVLRSNLKDIIEVTNYASLPIIGVVAKLYVTQDTNKLYRWNGTDYVDVSNTDLTGVELQSNKSGTLTASSTSYPNNNAVIAGLATKQNTISGTANRLTKFTGANTIGNSSFTESTAVITSTLSYLQLADTGGFIFSSTKANGWADNVTSRFFQVGDVTSYGIFSAATGASFERLAFASKKTQFTDGSYTSLAVPTGVFEVVTSGVKALSVVPASGNILINNAADDGSKFNVNGSAKVASLSITTTPTTSTGTPPLLTYNATTGAVESVPYSTFTSASNAVLLTGNQTKTGILTMNNSTGNNNYFSGYSSSNNAVLAPIQIGVSSSGSGSFSYITGAGAGFYAQVATNGIGFRSQTITNGAAFVADADPGATGDMFDFRLGGNIVGKFNNIGELTVPKISVTALNTAPASATATGTTGEIRVTATHIYVCTATNTWVRSALTTW